MDTEHYKQKLLAKQQELEALLKSARDSLKPVELDQASVGRLSRIDAMQMQAMALASEERRKQELHRIDTALKRIDSGDYGYCIKCGEEIAGKRLELDPTILVCVNCAGGGEQ